MEAAAVASLVGLTFGSYCGEPIATGELHELHRYVTAHRPIVASPSRRIPFHIGAPNPLGDCTDPAGVLTRRLMDAVVGNNGWCGFLRRGR